MVDGAVKPNLENILLKFRNRGVDLSTYLYQADAEEEKSEAGDKGQEVPAEDNQSEVVKMMSMFKLITLLNRLELRRMFMMRKW